MAKAEEIIDDAEHKAGRMSEKAKESLHQAKMEAEKAKEQLKDVKSQMKSYVEDKPMESVIIAAAAGAILGSLWTSMKKGKT